MKQRTNHIFCRGLALLALVLVTGCYERKSSSSSEVDGRSVYLSKAGAGAGNGDGYLGLISSAYQVIPGYECSDGNTRKLAYAAALVRTADNKVLLTSDQCENQAIEIKPNEIELLEKDGSRMMVRGGMFETRATVPDPSNKKDIYTQVSCQWKGGGHRYTVSVKSNMAGDNMEFNLHTKWRESGAQTKSHRWITKRVPVTYQAMATSIVYRGVTADAELVVDFTRKMHPRKAKFWGSVRYVSATESVVIENASCSVNRQVDFAQDSGNR